MSSLYSWIYVDYTNSIWKFSKNDNNELCYSTMVEEEKLINDSIIDNNVLEYAVYVEENGKIHIVYSNLKGEIKYCTMKDNQWIGKTISFVNIDESEIHDININIIGNVMHIFYLQLERNSRNHAILIHSIWDGKEIIDTKLTNIIMASGVKENYIVKVDKTKNIHLLFFSSKGEEITLNYCNYKENRWSLLKRLYSIDGDHIEFELLYDQQYMHILNKYREDSIYFLDYVRVEKGGDIQNFRVYESSKELTEPLLFELNNRLYSCWLEENDIIFSEFDGINWRKPVLFNKGSEDKIVKYHFFIACDKDVPIKEREVYGTDAAALNLYFPSQLVLKSNELFNSQLNKSENTQADITSNVETLQNLKMQLYRDKSENRQLKKRITSLNMQLQKKQKIIDDYKERIAKTLEQKQKLDQNCNVFMEMQQKMQKELSTVKKQVIEEKKLKINIENKLKETEEKNVTIRQQVDRIIEERDHLNKELELEKNKSIMERLLKG